MKNAINCLLFVGILVGLALSVDIVEYLFPAVDKELSAPLSIELVEWELMPVPEPELKPEPEPVELKKPVIEWDFDPVKPDLIEEDKKLPKVSNCGPSGCSVLPIRTNSAANRTRNLRSKGVPRWRLFNNKR